MTDATFAHQTALKYDVEVSGEGRVEVDVPLSPGARVVVFIIAHTAEMADDLAAAAQSSLDFWDNPIDDERWNEA